jgi:hypothetical protein
MVGSFDQKWVFRCTQDVNKDTIRWAMAGKRLLTFDFGFWIGDFGLAGRVKSKICMFPQ